MTDIFDRVARIVKAKTSGVLDKFENDPAVIDQTIIDAKKELAELKGVAAPVFKAAQNAEEEIAHLQDKAARYMSAAEEAARQGDDGAAQELLEKNAAYLDKAEKQKGIAAQQKESADALRKKINILVSGINDMEDVAELAKANIANEKAAKASVKITGEGATRAFDRIASKAAERRATAEALMEDIGSKDGDDPLLAKYGGSSNKTSLEELKAKMGV